MNVRSIPGRPILAVTAVALFVGCRDTPTPVEPRYVKVSSTEEAELAQAAFQYVTIDLGSIGDISESVAVDVNESGTVLAVATRDVHIDEASTPPLVTFVWKDGVVTEVDPLPGGLPSFPLTVGIDINEQDQIVGWAYNGSNFRAFLWEDGATMELGTLPGYEHSGAFGINEAGQVVGSAQASDGRTRAFVWQNGAMTDLGSHGSDRVVARNINEAGQVVGHYRDEDFMRHAFLWEDGVMTDLGHLGGGWTDVSGLNEVGEVIGTSRTTALGESHAFIWSEGEMTDLGVPVSGACCSRAVAINDAGQVVMTALGRAFLWEHGAIQDLGTLGGSGTFVGGQLPLNRSLNSHGLVVGQSRTSAGDQHAFVWDGTMHALDGLGGALGDAEAINDAGHVVGWSRNHDRQLRATLWRPLTPVEAVHEILQQVSSIEASGYVNVGQARALTNKLNIAAAMIEDGKTQPAANILGAFIAQIESLMSDSDPLPETEGQPLIDAANSLIQELGG